MRSNRGGEFITIEFDTFCNDKGIKRYMSTPRTPPQNGIVERRNSSIMSCTRKLMMEKNVAPKYWREVGYNYVYLE